MSEVFSFRARCRLPRARQLNKRHLLVGSEASKSGTKYPVPNTRTRFPLRMADQ